MEGNSSPIESRQRDAHPRLRSIVARHLTTPSRAPKPTHTRLAFESLEHALADHDRPRILDSGCGTAASTALLAGRFPGATVIGIDRSAPRLATRIESWPDNALRVRADAAALWRLAADANWRLAAHYLLYPNPSPKPEQLKRRWHGHPAFADLLALGGALTLRTNWEIYAQEFAIALDVAGVAATVTTLDAAAPALSPFDLKYQRSGHPRFELRALLCSNAR